MGSVNDHIAAAISTTSGSINDKLIAFFSAVAMVNGSPEGVLTAPVGSLALRMDGGAGTTLYTKVTGVGNTGWVTASGALQGRAIKQVRRTSASIVWNPGNTNWGSASGDASLDMIFTAAQVAVGDFVTVDASGAWAGSTAVAAYIDVQSVVAAAAVNSWGTDAAANNGDFGVSAWHAPAVAAGALAWAFGGGVGRTILAGDLSAGALTLRPYLRTATAASRTLFATTGFQLTFKAINWGPI